MSEMDIEFAGNPIELRERLAGEESLRVVCDANLSGWFERIGIDAPVIWLEASEANKSIDTAVDVCRWLISLESGRDTLLLAIGGGFTSDVAGFAASIFKRGIRYANVPTTLLAQVDAAIGGKTGVNLDGLKNMLGTIAAPEFTWICPQFLETLPRREFLSGAAEMLKTFLVADRESYEGAVKALKGKDPKAVSPFALKAARIKAAITGEDPFEHGRRTILNLGHTWGHAIEWYEQTRPVAPHTHGEAVAIGIIRAVQISELSGVAPAGLASRIAADFQACSLPASLPYPDEDLAPAILQDKKNSRESLRMVLLKDIGEASVVEISKRFLSATCSSRSANGPAEGNTGSLPR